MTELKRFVLSSSTLELFGRAFGVTVRRYPLELPDSGTGAERAYRLVHDELDAAGLAADGRPKPEVERAVLLLAGAEVSVAAVADDAQGHWCARAVSDGWRAVLVEQLDEEIVFSRLPVPGWEPSLAALLPELRPAPGEPVTVTLTPSGEEADEEPSGVAHLPTSPGPTSMTEVAEVLAAPRNGSGRFVVTGTDSAGDPVTMPLSWVDTERGGYAVADVPSAGGPVRRTYVPVDNTTLGDLLRERTERIAPVAV